MRAVFKLALACVPLTAVLSAAGLQEPETRGGGSVAVSRSVDALPDFVCAEKIVSTTLNNGKPRRERVIESVFRSAPRVETTATGTVVSFEEVREVVRVDGKAVGAKDSRKMPEAPILFDGLAANGWFFTSRAPRSDPSTSDASTDGQFKIRVAYSAGRARGTFAVEFPRQVLSRLQVNASDTAKRRVQSNESAGDSLWRNTVVEFQAIDIGAVLYWLPALVKAEVQINGNEVAVYSAEYTGCRKFDVTTTIRAVP